jgi:hypothetical protein
MMDRNCRELGAAVAASLALGWFLSLTLQLPDPSLNLLRFMLFGLAFLKLTENIV